MDNQGYLLSDAGDLADHLYKQGNTVDLAELVLAVSNLARRVDQLENRTDGPHPHGPIPRNPADTA